MSYESPIRIMDNSYESVSDVISKHVAEGVDNLVVEAVVNVGVHVDKDELEKALRYDRGQYEKGYEDGKRDAAAAIEALQAEVAFYKKRVCELCGTCPDDISYPDNCEIAGHGMWVGVNPLVDSVQCSICGGMLYSKELETPYCPYCGAKMEVQE